MASLISLYCHTTMQSGPISHAWYLYNFLPFMCRLAGAKCVSLLKDVALQQKLGFRGMNDSPGWLKVHLDGSEQSLHVPRGLYCKNISTRSLGFNSMKSRWGVGGGVSSSGGRMKTKLVTTVRPGSIITLCTFLTNFCVAIVFRRYEA